MGSATEGCLDDLAAFAFVEGTATEVERTQALDHLERCEDCRALISGLFSANELATVRERRGPRPPGVVVSPSMRGDDAPAADEDRIPIPCELSGYRFVELLAEGGMGRIYRAIDIELGREVAIKVPRSRHRALRARFEREVAITARLQHPGIVPLHGAGNLPSGAPFYVMRYVDGIALDEARHAAKDAAAIRLLLGHVLAVADTMAYVHREGIAHRDLKPNNILISKFDETLIIDWGLAKPISTGISSRDSLPTLDARDALDDALLSPAHDLRPLTRVGDVLGTPAFMAPEQAAGAVVDQRADVYALGAILGYVLTGRTPDGTALGEVPVAPALRAIWDRARAADPEARHPDAGAFANELRAALAPAVALGPAPRRWWLAGAIAIGALGAGVGVLALRRAKTVVLPPTSIAQPKVLAQVPSDTHAVSVSPSGAIVGYGSLDRLEVRELATGKTWSKVGWTFWSVAQFVDDSNVELAVSTTLDGKLVRARWNFRTDALTELSSFSPNASWQGRLASGRDVVTHRDLDESHMRLEGSGSAFDVTTFHRETIGTVSISPSGRRLAFIDLVRPQRGVVRVVDDDENRELASPELADLTAVSWVDDHYLIYATGTTSPATLYLAEATTAGLRDARALFVDEADNRWFGALAFGGHRLVGLRTSSSFETKLLDRSTRVAESLDRVAISAPLGWRDASTYYAWNRGTGEVEVRTRTGSALPQPTGTKLVDDPASATFANGMMIVAMRASGGRRVEAYRLGESTPAWSAKTGMIELVRCAGDVAPPCVAGVIVGEGTLELRHINPQTGALGEVVVPAGSIVDAAIDRAGNRLAWTSHSIVRERALGDSSAPIEELPSGPLARAVAFDPSGGLLLAYSQNDERTLVHHRGTEVEQVYTTQDAVISLVRPSPDGAHVLFRTRYFSSDIAELPFAPR